MYRVILHNEQGALLDDRQCKTKESIVKMLNEWYNPESIAIRIYKGDEDEKEITDQAFYDEILEIVASV